MPRRSPLFRPVRSAEPIAQAEDGVTAVEFALLAPILIVLLLGMLEISWRLFAEYRLTRAASAVAELVARSRDLHEGDLTDAFRATEEISSPFSLRRGGAVVVSSVFDPTGNRPIIVWQRRYPAGTSRQSRIGPPGGAAMLQGLDLAAGDNVVVAELFFTFEPLIGLLWREPQELYYRWIAAPRFGALTEVLP
jgi:Flp pilus assembly pilin Flp